MLWGSKKRETYLRRLPKDVSVRCSCYNRSGGFVLEKVSGPEEMQARRDGSREAYQANSASATAGPSKEVADDLPDWDKRLDGLLSLEGKNRADISGSATSPTSSKPEPRSTSVPATQVAREIKEQVFELFPYCFLSLTLSIQRP